MDNMKNVFEHLLYTEVLRADGLCADAIAQGFNNQDIIRIIYKCGVMDGRKREHKRTNAAHKKLNEYKQLAAAKCSDEVFQPTPGVVKEEPNNE